MRFNGTEIENEFAKLKGRVKNSLAGNLGDHKTVRVIIRGAHGQAMIGTDSRVFVCKPGLMAGATFGAEVSSWSYASLLGVQVHKGFVSGSVVLQGPGQTGKKTSYWGLKDDDPAKAPNAIPVAGDWNRVQAGAAELRQLIDAAHAPAPPTAQASVSLTEELERLAALRDRGMLNEDEFQAAKLRLMGQ